MASTHSTILIDCLVLAVIASFTNVHALGLGSGLGVGLGLGLG